MSEKVNIPMPPGGELTCADSQLAIVHVVDGAVYAECVSPPRGQSAPRDDEDMKRWALGKISGWRPSRDEPLPENYEQALASGKYEHADGQGLSGIDASSAQSVITYFRLPRNMKQRR